MEKYSIEYDEKADAAYIRVNRGKVADSIEAEKNIIVDLDKNKKLIGIEILNFSKMKINIGSLIANQFENLAVIK